MSIYDNVKYEIVVNGKTSIMLGKFLKMAMRDGLRPSSFKEAPDLSVYETYFKANK